MLRIGQFIDNRYEILEVIGSGGMADVYKAKCHKLNRIVAIKMLKKDYIDNAELVSRFQIEAQAAACLSHSNIVGIYDVGQSEDYQYIVMEYVEGKTLKELIEEKGALDEKEAVAIATQIAQGLAAAHQQGIIHRDIKPQNILISSDGKAKVADFGIARIARFGNTIELMPAGSVHYIAPEQARGGYCDERSDIYALGATMYEMVTGVVPFDGESAVAIAVAHMNTPVIEPVKRNESVSPALNSIILKCMNKKPDDRYPSALALILDLKKAVLTPGVMIASIATSAVGGVSTAGTTTTKSKTIIMDSSMVNQLKKENGHLGEGKKSMANSDNKNNLESEESEEKATLADKIILGLGIGMGILILVAVIYVVASLSSMWSNSGNTQKTETTSSAESNNMESSSEDNGLASDETFMPDVLGMELQEAIKLLDERNLQYEIPQSAYSDKYESGTICKQQYEEGTVLKKHTTVELVISLGDGKFKITEDLIGMSRQVFEVKVSGYDLDITYIEEENDDYTSGRIFKTEPESGTLESGDELTVYVSTGASYCKMPKLLNLDREQAIATIEEYGLVVGEISTEYNSEVDNGLVCSQSIVTGKKVKNGTSVDIVISLGRKTVTVPNVTGLTEEQAISKLTEHELSVGDISYESSNAVAEGKVIAQTPTGYEKAKAGDKVDLVISSGKASLGSVSNIVGKTESDAKGLLSTAGLRYVKSVYEYSDTVKSGSVISVEYYDKDTKQYYKKDVFYEGDYVVLVVSSGKAQEETTEEETTVPETAVPEETTEGETAVPETTKAQETTKASEVTDEGKAANETV